MRWNFDNPTHREGTNCVKYDLREKIFGTKDVIPLWVADMDFNTPDFITRAVKDRAAHEIYGYTFRSEKYFSSISQWIASRYHWQIQNDWITFCPGIVPALNFCTLAFTQPGDGIIVQPPVYFPFFSAVEKHDRKLIYNGLIEKDGRWTMDFDSLDHIAGEDTRMIFISNPHNPVGRAWSRDELEQLADFCIARNILMVSDEIHCDLVLPGFTHTPLASLSSAVAEKTITCMAPSKTFNLAGLSTSSVIISDPQLRKNFNRLVSSLHVDGGNIFGAVASEAAYTHGREWLDELLEYLSGNVEYVTSFCAKYLPEIIPVEPEATYMIWLDCRKLGMKGNELQNFFINKAGIGMNEGSTFGPGGEGFMRMNLAAPRKTIGKAMEQIKNALEVIR